jgi:acyl carrier protein
MKKENNKKKLEKEVKKLLSTVLQTSIAKINSTCSTITIDNWDSLKHIQVVLSLEKFYKIKFDVNEYNELTSFNNIIKLLRKKKKI